MKQLFFLFLFATLLAGTQISCGSKCKKCHTEIMGVKSPEKELCGEELKQAEKSGALICN